MNANDVINLVNAGFTKKEIVKMFPSEQEAKPKEQEAKPKEQEAKPKEQEAENKNFYAEMIKKLDSLADAIKNNNVRTPMPFSPTDTETKADNFFANIISPKIDKEGSNE